MSDTPRPRGRERSFLWSVGPARALLEGWLLGGLLYVAIVSQYAQMSPGALPQGTVLATAVAALWTALRMAYAAPAGAGRARLRAWMREALLAVALGAAVAAGWSTALSLLGWLAVPVEILGRFLHVAALLAAGVNLFAVRVGLALWRYWRQLVHRYLLCAIANTYAELVLVLAVVMAATLTAAQIAGGYIGVPTPGSGTLAWLLQDIVFSVFPVVGVAAALTVGTLVVLLPPAALVSYRTARRTTRRLAELVRAAERMRGGDYAARVVVTGEDEVARLQGHFNAMADDLQQALRSLEKERDRVARLLAERRELVASVSHELRTPVATLRGYLEAMQGGAGRPAEPTTLPATLRQDLQVMEGELQRLQRLIEDLYTLSQAEAGGLDLTLAPTDLVALGRARVQALAPLAWAQGRVEITFDAPVGEPVVACVDAGRLEQALGNLLRNALRHTPPGGIICVTVREDGAAAEVVVRDTGEGIPPEELPHVWERFYRGSTARAREGGAGLGLALVKELTEAMGGTAQVASLPGEGASFTLRFPRA